MKRFLLVLAILLIHVQAHAQTSLFPRTNGGAYVYKSLDLDETEEQIKAAPGQVYGYFLYNNSASLKVFRFYNATAANVTVGTTVPKFIISLPANSGANLSISVGIEFDTAITIACTTGVADNDTGAPGANECIADVFYY